MIDLPNRRVRCSKSCLGRATICRSRATRPALYSFVHRVGNLAAEGLQSAERRRR